MTKSPEQRALSTLGAYADEDAGSPPSSFPDYRSTTFRSPLQAPLPIAQTLTEVSGPAGCWERLMGTAVADLTRQHAGTPLGQRIIVQGHVLDEDHRPVPHTVIEIWQANASGRYIHSLDHWDAPLDLFPDSHYLLNLSSPSGVPRGEAIDLRGRVLDGRGEAVPDAMLEIWQANAAGRYASLADRRDGIPLDPHFIGFGRAATGADGEFHFRTIRPGRVPGPDGTLQAPHIALSILGRVS